MRIIATSDIHGYEPYFSDWGEVIVIAGDLTAFGRRDDLAKFSRWILREAKQRRSIVFIAGNHDWIFQTDRRRDAQQPLCSPKDIAALESAKADWLEAGNIHYLEDSGVEIDGVKFWGSPWTPMFYNWAFMHEDERLAEYWAKIPTDTDVLITHGGPHGILDQTRSWTRAGSETLYKRVLLSDLAPKVHIFGHIHEAYGSRELGAPKTVRFYNVAYCDLDYEPVQPPVHILLDTEQEYRDRMEQV